MKMLVSPEQSMGNIDLYYTDHTRRLKRVNMEFQTEYTIKSIQNFEKSYDFFVIA